MATIRHSIDIKAPVHILYNQLTHFEDYPRFMDEVESVSRVDDTHLHWTAHMAGQPLEWDAEISEQQEDRCIAWRNLGGPAGEGRVDLQSRGKDDSRLTFTLQAPPEPQATEEDIAQRLHGHLLRLKEIVESQTAREAQSSYAAGSEGFSADEFLNAPSPRVQPGKVAALRNDSAGPVSNQWTRPASSTSKERTMQIVSEVMTPDVRFVSPQESLQRAAQMMDELNVGALPVCDGKRLVGMVTDRDITVRGTAVGKMPGETQVEEVMSGDVRWCFEDQPLDEVMQQMADTQIRRVPVVTHDEAQTLVGIVSLGDIATKSIHAAKRDVEDVMERIASPSEPDRSSSAKTTRRARSVSKADAAYPPGVTARVDPSGGTSDQRHAGNKDDSGSISAGAEDAGTSGGVAGTSGSGGSDLGSG
jgi:CBS domain-containing protein